MMARESVSSTIHSSPDTSRVEREREPTTGLLSRLADEVTTLLQKEFALAACEFSDALTRAKNGAISLASGGGVLFAGFLVLLAAAVLGLAKVMEPWLAALIVGALVALVGFVMVQVGKNRLEPSAFKPERTQNALRKDQEMVKRRAA
jgi:lipopolysaccharide export LptBFGC system permease protein LptF